MIKSFLEFLATGALVITGYFTYFVVAVIATFVIGLPIGLAVYLIKDAITVLFSGV